MYKIGDIFEDGGFKYKVVGMHELGYPISKRITDADVKEPVKVEEITKEDVKEPKELKFTKTQILRMSAINLERLCDELELKKGTSANMKLAIIEKLGL